MGNYIANAVGKIPKKGLFLRTENRKESPCGPRSMKRILIIILFSFFSYFFLSYSSPRTAPVTLCITIEQARGNHAIRNRKWEKGVLQRVCGVFQMYLFSSIFPHHIVSKVDTLMQNSTGCENSERTLSLCSEKQEKEPL